MGAGQGTVGIRAAQGVRANSTCRPLHSMPMPRCLSHAPGLAGVDVLGVVVLNCSRAERGQALAAATAARRRQCTGRLATRWRRCARILLKAAPVAQTRGQEAAGGRALLQGRREAAWPARGASGAAAWHGALQEATLAAPAAAQGPHRAGGCRRSGRRPGQSPCCCAWGAAIVQ